MAQELQVFCSRSECNQDESVKCVDCEYLVTEKPDAEDEKSIDYELGYEKGWVDGYAEGMEVDADADSD